MRRTIVTMLVMSMSALMPVAGQMLRLEGGMSLSLWNTNIDGSCESEEVVGYQWGVLGELLSDGTFAFETGLLYSQRGGSYSKHEEWEVSTASECYVSAGLVEHLVKLSYVDVPLHVRMSARLSKRSKWFITFGPYVGWALWGTVRPQRLEEEQHSDFRNVRWGEEDVDYKMRRWDLGYAGALGVEWKSGVYLKWRIQQSGLDVSALPSVYIYNWSMQLSLGYTLRERGAR